MPSRAAPGWLLAAAAVLGGCARPVVLPDLPNDTPRTWQSAADAAALGPAPDLDSWWRAFGDPRLDELVARARAQNLTVAQAQLRLRGARALQRRSATQYDPQASFHTFSEPDPNGSTSYFEIGFDALWELGLFGRGQADARIASADAQGAAADVVAAQVSVSAEVVRSYVDLRAAQARAALLDQIVAQRREQQRLADKLVALRLGTRAAADRAGADLAAAIADAAEPAATIVQAQQSLAVLLADPQLPLSLPPSAPPVVAPLAVAEAPADLLRTRPEIRKAELAVLKAAGELGLARADLYPKLALGGSLTSSTRLTGDVDHANKAVLSVGPLIQWPIFDRGARHRVIDARDAALQAAVLGYRQAVFEGVAEAQTALAQLERQRARVAALRDNETRRERAAKSAATLRGLGLADANDGASAGLALAEARLERGLAEHDLALAFVAVYKAFGGSLPPLQPDPPP